MNAKIPPQAPAFEKVILASFLVIPSTLDEYIEDVEPSIFYAPIHVKIMEAIQALYSSSKAVDIVSVVEQLKVSQIEDLGPYQDLLGELMSDIDTNHTLSSHIELVKSKFDLRRVIKVCNKGMQDSYLSDAVSDDVLAEAEGGLLEIYEKSEKSKPEHISKISMETLSDIKKGMEDSESIPGIRTGFKQLDKLTGGFRGGESIIMAGRPGSGKSSFALSVALNCGVPAAVFSLEMPKNQLDFKFKSYCSGVPLFKIRNMHLSSNEFMQVQAATNQIANLPIYIDDKPGLKIPELRSKLRRLKKRYGIKIAFIDYLQLMRGHKKTHSREQEISSISSSLKELSKELDIPIISLAQLSRAVEMRSDKKPMLSDLRESGSLEQDADMVLFIHRPEMYGETPENKGDATIIIGKQRNGPTTDVDIKFDKNTTYFHDPVMGYETKDEGEF